MTMGEGGASDLERRYLYVCYVCVCVYMGVAQN